MKMNRNVVTLAAVAGVAFVAGSLDLFSGGASVATAGPLQDESQSEMMAKMEAMMKAGTPGKHHEYLEQFVGNWEAVVKMREEADGPMMELPATVTRKWILDGHFLQESVVSESDYGTFHGLGFLGYNNMDGRYESVWMDSSNTAITMEIATFDPEANIMRTRGEQRDPVTGKLMQVRGETHITSPDRHVYKSYKTGPDGKEYLNFEGVFERTK